MPKFFPVEYNGFSFDREGRVSATFNTVYDWDISGISTKNSERLNERPEYSGAVLGGVAKSLSVYLNQPDLDRNDLVIAMDAGSNVQRVFYVKDELGKRWYVNAKATKLAYENHDGNTKITEFIFILDVDDPVYRSEAQFEDIWNVTLDEEVHVVTIGGNQPTNPTFTITPGTPSGYYPFTYYMKCFNPINRQQTDGMDITGGGWDTATLVTAGDMLANGDDVRVLVNGVEVPRWFGGGGMDSATTAIYIRLVWKAGAGTALTLKRALSGVTTPTYIEFKVTAAAKAVLATFPSASVFRVQDEEISYRNLDPVKCRAEIVQREVRGTSIAAHIVGTVTHWVEHDVRIIYGNPAAAAPVYDERFKPLWNLTTSTNSVRNYDDTTGFADTDGLRAGAFKRIAIDDGKGNKSRVYSEEHAGRTVIDPAEVMGMEIASYQKQGKVYPDTAELAWVYEHPAIILSVESDGEKWKAFSNTIWPNTPTLGAELQSSPDSVTWTREWNEAIPASANTWTPITNNTNETLPSGTRFIRYHFIGSVNGVVSNFIRFEINEAIVTLTSANLIQVGFNAFEANYQLEIEIRNNRTNQSIFINYPAAEGEPISVDTENFEVRYKGLNAIAGLSWDSIRTRWMSMPPGENELQFFSSFGTEMEIKTTTDNRAM